MAAGKKATLSPAGAAPVIREVTEAEFIERFADLIDRFDASITADARPDFAGAEAGEPHEHTTRVHFLDELGISSLFHPCPNREINTKTMTYALPQSCLEWTIVHRLQ